MTDTLIVTGARLPVLPPETVSMHLKDGTRLDADIYRPDGPGPWPVLLQRQAYGRRIACTICYAPPAWYASHGYMVVVQDVRGRGTSEGIFRPGENERSDGAQAVEWAARLPGSNGDVAMYGFSYQAYNQMLAAAGDCPSLKAIAPAMGPWDAGSTWAYENGALRMKQMVGWGIQITAEAARRAGDDIAYAELMAANGALPVNGPIAAKPAIVQKYRALSHVMDWLETPSDDPYWVSISPVGHAAEIRARDLPMLFIGGWFDTHLASTTRAFRALATPGNPKVRLIIGPWLHFPWVRHVGQMDFGPEAQRDLDREHIRFFDHVLKGAPAPVAENPVSLFDMGTKTWRGFPGLPDTMTGLALSSTGRASIDVTDGSLSPGPAGTDETDYIVHDPWRPAPVVGGCYGVPNGPVDRRGHEDRGDVVTYTTAPAETPFTIAGEPEVALTVSSDRPSFDLSLVLSRVTADGRVFQIAAGYAHYRTAPAGLYRLGLTATCATIAPGERLRLAIAASDYPAHPVNPGTGEDPVSTPKTRAVVTTVAIHSGPSGPSLLRIPLADAGDGPGPGGAR